MFCMKETHPTTDENLPKKSLPKKPLQKSVQKSAKKTSEKINPKFRLFGSIFIDLSIIFVAIVYLWFFVFEVYTNAFVWSAAGGIIFWLILALIMGRPGWRFSGVRRDGSFDAQMKQLESYFTYVSALYFVWLSAYYMTNWVLSPRNNVLFGIHFYEPLIYRGLSIILAIISFLSAWFLVRVRKEGFVPGLLLVVANLLVTSYQSSVSSSAQGRAGGNNIGASGMGGFYGYGGLAAELMTVMSQLLPLIVFIFLLSTMSRSFKKQ